MWKYCSVLQDGNSEIWSVVLTKLEVVLVWESFLSPTITWRSLFSQELYRLEFLLRKSGGKRLLIQYVSFYRLLFKKLKRPECVSEIVFEYKGKLIQNWKFVHENVRKQKVGMCDLGTRVYGIWNIPGNIPQGKVLRETATEFRKYLISSLTINAAQGW